MKWLTNPDYRTGGSLLKSTLIFASMAAIGIGLASDTTLPERIVLMRYVYFLLAGLLAFITPWVLFPQKPLYLFQAVNPDVRSLMKILTGRLKVYFLGVLVLLTTVAFAGFRVSALPLHFALWLDGMIFTSGIFAFASYRFLRMGQVSQLWQEGVRGKKLLDYMKEVGSGPGVPAGSLPTVGTTTLVAASGMGAVVLGAYLSPIFGIYFNAFGGVVLLIMGVWGWARKFHKLDVDFYHTHGFYNELFRNPGGIADAGRDPLPVASLYWVPSDIKPIVWLSLRQMDRKIPLGRILVAVFLLYWSFIFSGFSGDIIVEIFPIAMILAKNSAIYRLTTPAFAPARFQQLMGSPIRWFIARCYMNFRWALPFHFFTLLTVWQVGSLSAEKWYMWLIIDAISMIVIPAIITLLKEGKIKHQYA